MTLSSSNERTEAISAFLASAGWGGATPRPLAGDASTRRYIRLVNGSGSALLMDAPPKAEGAPCPPDADEATRVKLGYNALARLAGPDSRRFGAFAATLAERGLNAPKIYVADYDQGLLLIEDLGDDLFARAIERGTPSLPMYEAAIDVLLALHEAPAPDTLGNRAFGVPLLAYDRLAYMAEVDLLIEWLYPLVTGYELSDEARAEWKALWADVLGRLGTNEPVIVLRDYHAENLFWLPDRKGLARVGLIDFQDGLRGARAYDLVSLIEDARRDVDPGLAGAMCERYIVGARARNPHFDVKGFRRDLAILGAQRNAKILGIFSRLWRRDGKPAYLRLLPRVWRYMERDLQTEELAPLRAWLDSHLPHEMRIAPTVQ